MATVMAKCSKCKELFEMDEELYNHRKAHGSKINCPDCLKKSHENKYKKASETHKKNWASYDPEARAKRVQNAKEGIHNMSDEKKALRSLHSSIATKEYMASLSEEEKQRRSEMTTKQMMERNANMSYDDFIEHCTKVALTTNATESSIERAAPTELAFMDDMKLHLISYKYEHYNTTIHPEFFKRFPNNPVTGARYTNPFHRWDFRLEIIGHPMFVDVDGSAHSPKNASTGVHNPTGTHYKRIDDIKFNESKRPYQHDDIDAYVILAYDNTLGPDNTVVNIVTNETMTYKDFLGMLDKLSGISDEPKSKKSKKKSKK